MAPKLGDGSIRQFMKIESQKDFFSGLMFTCVGIAFAWGASTYKIGSGARMGAGYFPFILGLILAVLGSAIVVKSMTIVTADGDKMGHIAWKPLLSIILANLVFGVAIGGLPAIGLPPLGLVAGIYLLTFIAANGGDTFRFKEIFIVATLLVLMIYLAFVVLLKLQIPAWPAFLTG